MYPGPWGPSEVQLALSLLPPVASFLTSNCGYFVTFCPPCLHGFVTSAQCSLSKQYLPNLCLLGGVVSASGNVLETLGGLCKAPSMSFLVFKDWGSDVIHA